MWYCPGFCSVQTYSRLIFVTQSTNSPANLFCNQPYLHIHKIQIMFNVYLLSGHPLVQLTYKIKHSSSKESNQET